MVIATYFVIESIGEKVEVGRFKVEGGKMHKFNINKELKRVNTEMKRIGDITWEAFIKEMVGDERELHCILE